MGDPYSLSKILWSSDPATQYAIGMVLIVFAIAAIAVLIPLAVRLFRLFGLERELDRLIGDSALKRSPRTAPRCTKS